MAAGRMGIYDFLAYEHRFPQHRVKKLMNDERYCGLTSHVLVEGAFIELTAEGLPVQQVYLGLTSGELILVTQEVAFKVNTKKRGDLELEGLLLDAIYPMSVVRFSLSKDRPMTFSVKRPDEKVQNFEMCKLDAGFRAQWHVWEHALSEWIDKQPSKKLVVPPVPPSPVKTPSFQASTLTDISSSTESDMGISSADSDDLKSDQGGHGMAPSQRLGYLYGGNYIQYTCNLAEEKSNSILKSSSWCDVFTGYTATSEAFDVKSFQKLLKRREAQSRQKIKSFFEGDNLSDTSDEGDLDAMFLEAENILKNKSNTRSGAQLWCRAKLLVMGNSADSFNRKILEETVHQIVFQTMSARKRPVARSLLDCRPFEVALEFAIISRRLLMAICPSDLQQARRTSLKVLPERIQRVRMFGENISKLVMAEILSSNVLSERVTTIKYLVEVCHHLLFTQKDFQTLVFVLRGMTSLPVYRLDNTWATFFVQEPLTFRQFQAIVSLLSSSEHYKSYRTRISACNVRNNPYIPWFDHFLVHCNRNRDISTDFPQLTISKPMKHIKVSRQQRVHKVNQQKESVRSAHSDKADRKIRKVRVKPFIGPGPSSTKPRKSILKKQKAKKKQNKVMRFFNFFKIKKSRRVKFNLSKAEVKRQEEKASRNSNMKHLAKTRLFPIDLRADFETDTAEFERQRAYLGPKLSTIENFSEGKSNKIISEAFMTIEKPKETDRGNSENIAMKYGAFNLDAITENPKESPIGVTEQDNIDKQSSKICTNTKKGPVAWIQKKTKDRRQKVLTKLDINHVNHVQRNIDCITDMLQGLEQPNVIKTDSGKQVSNGIDAKDRTIENQQHIGIKQSATREDQGVTVQATEGGLNVERKEVRRKSYIPVSVVKNRRQSLFEQAFDEERDDIAEIEFTRSMDRRLKGLKGRRRSVAMELLETENSTRPGLFRERDVNSCNNSFGKASLPCPTDSNTIRTGVLFSRSKGTSADNRHGLTRSLSAERLGLSQVECDNCVYCGGEPCIYSDSVFSQLIVYQTQALSAFEQSNNRVRECLKSLLNSVDHLYYSDFLTLSLYKE